MGSSREIIEIELLMDFYAHGIVGFLVERRMIQDEDKEALIKQVTNILSLTPVLH